MSVLMGVLVSETDECVKRGVSVSDTDECVDGCVGE